MAGETKGRLEDCVRAVVRKKENFIVINGTGAKLHSVVVPGSVVLAAQPRSDKAHDLPAVKYENGPDMVYGGQDVVGCEMASGGSFSFLGVVADGASQEGERRASRKVAGMIAQMTLGDPKDKSRWIRRFAGKEHRRNQITGALKKMLCFIDREVFKEQRGNGKAAVLLYAIARETAEEGGHTYLHLAWAGDPVLRIGWWQRDEDGNREFVSRDLILPQDRADAVLKKRGSVAPDDKTTRLDTDVAGFLQEREDLLNQMIEGGMPEDAARGYLFESGVAELVGSKEPVKPYSMRINLTDIEPIGGVLMIVAGSDALAKCDAGSDLTRAFYLVAKRDGRGGTRCGYCFDGLHERKGPR